MPTLRVVTLALSLLAATPAGAIVLVDQRSTLVTSVGNGTGGADLCTLQASLGLTSLGFTATNSAGFIVADDVTFATAVDIDTITVYAYQTGSSTTSPFNALFIQVFDGTQPGGAPLFGNNTTNRFGSSIWSNIYRVTETTQGNTTRPIMAVTSVDLGLTLPAGTYWIAYSLTGTFTQAFTPARATLGIASPPGSNGLQSNGSSWVALTDGAAPQGVAFTITGTPAGAGPDAVFANGFE